MNGTTYAGRRARTTGAPQTTGLVPPALLSPVASERSKPYVSCGRVTAKSSTIAVPSSGMDHASARVNLESNRIGSSNALFLCFYYLNRTHALSLLSLLL